MGDTDNLGSDRAEMPTTQETESAAFPNDPRCNTYYTAQKRTRVPSTPPLSQHYSDTSIPINQQAP